LEKYINKRPTKIHRQKTNNTSHTLEQAAKFGQSFLSETKADGKTQHSSAITILSEKINILLLLTQQIKKYNISSFNAETVAGVQCATLS